MMLGMMMCKEATRLMSKRLDAPLSFSQRLSLGMHLAMCGACKRCNRQFALLHEAGRHYEDHAPASHAADDAPRP